MATALTVMLIVHIICGFMALITGFISMLNRKGGQQHRLTGQLFFAGMTGVFISATFIAVAKSLAFLFMVGFFSYYLACSGYRILYLKKLHLGQRAKVLDWAISSVGVLAGLGLILFSATWFRERGAWGAVPFTFGTFCLINGIMDIKNFFIPPTNKQYWLFTHGLRMGGAFGSTLTAFTVVNVSIGNLTWLLWILPGSLVGLWISRILKSYRPKSAALKTQSLAATH